MKITEQGIWTVCESVYKKDVVRIALTKAPPGCEGTTIGHGRTSRFMLLMVLRPRAVVCHETPTLKPVGQTFPAMLITMIPTDVDDTEYIVERLGVRHHYAKRIIQMLHELSSRIDLV